MFAPCWAKRKSHLLIVHPSLPARSVKELIALARARPGQLNFSSSGVGNAAPFAEELFDSMAGVKIVHVPYKARAARRPRKIVRAMGIRIE